MSFRGTVGEVVETGSSVFSLEWRIPDFPSLAGEGGYYYQSPAFDACDGQWSFQISPYGMSRNPPSAWVNLILGRLDKGPTRTFDATLGIRGPEGVENKRKRIQETSEDDDTFSWMGFCLRSKLTEQCCRLMPGKLLTFTLDLKMDEPSFAEVNKQLRKEVKSLMEQNKDLNRKCEKQTHYISKASSELRKACMDSEVHKKEMESLMEEIKILKSAVENYQTLSENDSKQMSSLERELTFTADQYKSPDKLTIASGIEKAARDNDAEEKDKGNNDDENDEESKNKKNLKQLSQVKNTKKISLTTRHRGVINSLKSILAFGRRADFTLKSDGREWPVYRAILEGRSGHFTTLFRGDWAEKDEVQVDDVAEGCLYTVLHFIYAGEFEGVFVENVCDIYVAAHRFLLEDLKSLCLEYMKKEMCPKMVCGALAIAETYEEGDLKGIALECFLREPNRIIATDGWKHLKENYPSIIAEMFKETIKREKNSRRKGFSCGRIWTNIDILALQLEASLTHQDFCKFKGHLGRFIEAGSLSSFVLG